MSGPMTVFDILAAVLMVLGAIMMCLAAVGVVRMPDLFSRLHCSTKSATLGVALVLFGAAMAIGTPGAWVRATLASLFFLLTAPIGGHALGRAAWRRGWARSAVRAPDPPQHEPLNRSRPSPARR